MYKTLKNIGLSLSLLAGLSCDYVEWRKEYVCKECPSIEEKVDALDLRASNMLVEMPDANIQYESLNASMLIDFSSKVDKLISDYITTLNTNLSSDIDGKFVNLDGVKKDLLDKLVLSIGNEKAAALTAGINDLESEANKFIDHIKDRFPTYQQEFEEWFNENHEAMGIAAITDIYSYFIGDRLEPKLTAFEDKLDQKMDTKEEQFGLTLDGLLEQLPVDLAAKDTTRLSEYDTALANITSDYDTTDANNTALNNHNNNLTDTNTSGLANHNSNLTNANTNARNNHGNDLTITNINSLNDYISTLASLDNLTSHQNEIIVINNASLEDFISNLPALNAEALSTHGTDVINVNNQKITAHGSDLLIANANALDQYLSDLSTTNDSEFENYKNGLIKNWPLTETSEVRVCLSTDPFEVDGDEHIAKRYCDTETASCIADVVKQACKIDRFVFKKDGDLYLMGRRGQQQIKLVGSYRNLMPPSDWLNANNIILTIEPNDDDTLDVYSLNIKTGSRTAITDTRNENEMYMSISPDKSKILYYTQYSREIYVMTLQDSVSTKLPISLKHALPESDWLNESEILINFKSDAVDNYEIYKYNISNNALENLTQTSEDEVYMSLSPDKTKVLYKDYNKNLFTYDLTNESITQVPLTFMNLSETSAWLNNSTVMVGLEPNNGDTTDVYTLNINTGNFRNITRTTDEWEYFMTFFKR